MRTESIRIFPDDLFSSITAIAGVLALIIGVLAFLNNRRAFFASIRKLEIWKVAPISLLTDASSGIEDIRVVYTDRTTRKQKSVKDPLIATVAIKNSGLHDITPGNFASGHSFVVGFGATIIKVLDFEHKSARDESVPPTNGAEFIHTPNSKTIEIPPLVLKRGSILRIKALTDGKSHIKVSDLVDTDIKTHSGDLLSEEDRGGGKKQLFLIALAGGALLTALIPLIISTSNRSYSYLTIKNELTRSKEGQTLAKFTIQMEGMRSSKNVAVFIACKNDVQSKSIPPTADGKPIAIFSNVRVNLPDECTASASQEGFSELTSEDSSPDSETIRIP